MTRSRRLMFLNCYLYRVAQRKRAGLITQRSVDRNHPLLPYCDRFRDVDPNNPMIKNTILDIQTAVESYPLIFVVSSLFILPQHTPY